eukprot:m.35214 g.35214  ORF g.35214 m.35214 type:complete len:61 (+) comp17102_c0_seq1:265-447(+)
MGVSILSLYKMKKIDRVSLNFKNSDLLVQQNRYFHCIKACGGCELSSKQRVTEFLAGSVV